MPTGSVKLQSIKKLGHENHSYVASDDGTVIHASISDSEHFSNNPGFSFHLKIITLYIYQCVSIYIYIYLVLQEQLPPTCKYKLLYCVEIMLIATVLMMIRWAQVDTV